MIYKIFIYLKMHKKILFFNWAELLYNSYEFSFATLLFKQIAAKRN